MSHDRGCACGREKYEYDDCTSKSCFKRNTTMKLADKLKETLDTLEKAKIKGIEARHKADMEKIKRERKKLEEWLNIIRDDLIKQIEEGRAPLRKVEYHRKQMWLKSVMVGNGEHQDLWDNFRRYWASEGLTPKLREGHDGMGIKSWINLTVEILPERPRTTSKRTTI